MTIIEFPIVMASYNGARPRIFHADEVGQGKGSWELVDATEEEYEHHPNQVIFEICAYRRGTAIEFQMRRLVGDAAD